MNPNNTYLATIDGTGGYRFFAEPPRLDDQLSIRVALEFDGKTWPGHLSELPFCIYKCEETGLILINDDLVSFLDGFPDTYKHAIRYWLEGRAREYFPERWTAKIKGVLL